MFSILPFHFQIFAIIWLMAVHPSQHVHIFVLFRFEIYYLPWYRSHFKGGPYLLTSYMCAVLES
jgi:hypothetical protein